MAKRKPDKQLTHDNWDVEDTPEEIGSFQKAPTDTLKGRVIKQARRRITSASSVAPDQKSIFAGFTGFTKQQESKTFTFNSNVTATTSANTTLNSQPYKFSFASTKNIANCTPNVEVADSKVDETEKRNVSKSTELPFSSTLPGKISNQGSPSVSKLNELSVELQKTESSAETENDQKTPDDIFLQKLRSLNLLCAEWIIKHLNENLAYILTPIFDDYQKYLNKLKEERKRNNSSVKRTKLEVPISSQNSITPAPNSITTFKVPDFNSSPSKFKSILNPFSEKKPSFTFPAPPTNGTSSFKFPTSLSVAKTDLNESKGDGSFFKFTAPPKEVPTIESPPKFSFNVAPTTVNPFLGINNFSASSSPHVTNDTDSKGDEDESPPVVNETITEDGSIYEKKCKVFVKKDGSFVERGIGFLFLKLIGDEKKCQLIVRANNKLATIILNVLLSDNIPMQLMGTNNVMLVCCPTPNAKPSTVLLRVKTADDAKELLSKLNEHKK